MPPRDRFGGRCLTVEAVERTTFWSNMRLDRAMRHPQGFAANLRQLRFLLASTQLESVFAEQIKTMRPGAVSAKAVG
jgi:hypothetical protein